MLARYMFLILLLPAIVAGVVVAVVVERTWRQRGLAMTLGLIAIAGSYAGLLAWGGAPDF